MINKQKVEKEYRKNIELGVIAALLICQTGFLVLRDQRLNIEPLSQASEPQESSIILLPPIQLRAPKKPPAVKPKINKIQVPKPVLTPIDPPQLIEPVPTPPVIIPRPVQPDTIADVVEILPSPIGGLKTIQEKLKYPKFGLKLSLEGRVFVRVLIDETGEIAKIRVWQTSGYDFFDEAAIEAISSVQWSPGILNNKPVKAWVSIPIKFILK